MIKPEHGVITKYHADTRDCAFASAPARGKTVEHRGQHLAYIEATKADIALANSIAHEVWGAP